MQRAICGFVLSIIITIAAPASATTYYRLPVAYIPYAINAWKDASSTTGIDKRYDGITIPSGSKYYYDNHRGTDFNVPYGRPVYAAAKGAVSFRSNSCAPNGGYKGNSCGGGLVIMLGLNMRMVWSVSTHI
jgi:murein DD-endopeptidase MepM/ murein hydrolase activator NlpD